MSATLFPRLVSFLSTLPAWGATGVRESKSMEYYISIHAPRVGSDFTSGKCAVTEAIDFYPRSPRGERRSPESQGCKEYVISIHAPRVGSDSGTGLYVKNSASISIHAPRVGSDHCKQGRFRLQGISIHAPRVGSDVHGFAVVLGIAAFLSTLPAWGATVFADLEPVNVGFLSTLPAWGATITGTTPAQTTEISIHAPRVGSDDIETSVLPFVKEISIHAPRVGSDLISSIIAA